MLAALAMLLTDARPGHAQAVDRSERAADRNELAAAGHEKATPRRSWDCLPSPATGAGTKRTWVGNNLQPRWTAHDGFGQLDVYVLPKGTGALAYELRPSRSRESGRTNFTSEYQAELGLPARIQLGLHAVGTETGSGGVLGNVHAQGCRGAVGARRLGIGVGKPSDRSEVERSEPRRGRVGRERAGVDGRCDLRGEGRRGSAWTRGTHRQAGIEF